MNKLKKINLVVCAFASALLLAGPADAARANSPDRNDRGRGACLTVPDTAEKVYWYDWSMSQYGDRAYYDTLDEYRLSFFRELETNFDAELNCRQVYVISQVYRIDPDGVFSYGRSGSIMFIAYCARRNMREMQMVNLHRKCIEAPTSDCYREGVLDYLEKIPPTQWIEEDRIYSNEGRFEKCHKPTAR